MQMSQKCRSSTNASLKALALLAFATLASAQPMTVKSIPRIMNFTESYSLEYFTHNENGITTVRFTLRYKDYDITNWST